MYGTQASRQQPGTHQDQPTPYRLAVRLHRVGRRGPAKMHRFVGPGNRAAAAMPHNTAFHPRSTASPLKRTQRVPAVPACTNKRDQILVRDTRHETHTKNKSPPVCTKNTQHIDCHPLTASCFSLCQQHIHVLTLHRQWGYIQDNTAPPSIEPRNMCRAVPRNGDGILLFGNAPAPSPPVQLGLLSTGETSIGVSWAASRAEQPGVLRFPGNPLVSPGTAGGSLRPKLADAGASPPWLQ